MYGIDTGNGIIPTRMGTSVFLLRWKSPKGDHPHAYGDKEIAMRLRTAQEGSSPRVWGQEICKLRRNSFRRIIPTRMGTSKIFDSTGNITWDHPHAYGDKFIFSFADFFLVGSSPRVWGQVIYKWFVSSFLRIIPTRMGTRGDKLGIMGDTGDHPHAYGDKSIA